MAETLTGTTVAEVMAELAALEDPKARAVNEPRRSRPPVLAD